MPILVLLVLALSACGGSADEGNSQEVLTQAAQIAIDGLTQTAAAAPPTASNTPEPTATNTPEPTPTFTNTPEGSEPTATNTQQAAQQPAGSSAPCWRGNLEYENVPDGSIYYQNKIFTKVWRIKNTGSCTWPADTVAFLVEGDLMGSDSVVAVTTEEIAPNEYLEVNIDFLSPGNVGTYKGYWMLRGGGAIFGVGPSGLSWFWVEVEVQVDPN